jgi:hypothetical protein
LNKHKKFRNLNIILNSIDYQKGYGRGFGFGYGYGYGGYYEEETPKNGKWFKKVLKKEKTN